MKYGRSFDPGPHSLHLGARVVLLAALIFALPALGLATEPKFDPFELQSLRDLRSIVLSVEAFQVDNGTVPGPTDGLVTTEFLLPFVEPIYIRSLPIHDGWGNPFRYWSDGNRFGVVSYGPDGSPDRLYVGAAVFDDGGDDLVTLDGTMAAVPLHLRPMIRGGEQKSTMGDLRSIAISVESYKIDNGTFPGPTPGPVDVAWIRELVQPIYIRTLPLTDAWGTPFVYWSDGERYRIASLGLDRSQDQPYEEIESGTATRSFTNDIVFEDGEFKQFPEGEQH